MTNVAAWHSEEVYIIYLKCPAWGIHYVTDWLYFTFVLRLALYSSLFTVMVAATAVSKRAGDYATIILKYRRSWFIKKPELYGFVFRKNVFTSIIFSSSMYIFHISQTYFHHLPHSPYIGHPQRLSQSPRRISEGGICYIIFCPFYNIDQGSFSSVKSNVFADDSIKGTSWQKPQLQKNDRVIVGAPLIGWKGENSNLEADTPA